MREKKKHIPDVQDEGTWERFKTGMSKVYHDQVERISNYIIDKFVVKKLVPDHLRGALPNHIAEIKTIEYAYPADVGITCWIDGIGMYSVDIILTECGISGDDFDYIYDYLDDSLSVIHMDRHLCNLLEAYVILYVLSPIRKNINYHNII